MSENYVVAISNRQNKIKLDEFVKKGSKINESDKKEAVNILKNLYLNHSSGDVPIAKHSSDVQSSKPDDPEVNIADYLMSLNPDICKLFFENIMQNVSNDELQSIIADIYHTEKYKKNAGGSSVLRGFIIVGLLLKHKIEGAWQVLSKIIDDHLSKGIYSDKTLEDFNNRAIKLCGIDSLQVIIDSNGHVPMSGSGDFQSSKVDSKNRLIKFIDTFKDKHYKNINTMVTAESQSTSKILEIEQNKPVDEEISTEANNIEHKLTEIEPKLSPITSEKDQPTQKLPLEIILDTFNSEIKSLVNNYIDEISELTEKHTHEKQIIQTDLLDSNKKIASLQYDIRKYEEQINILKNNLNDTEKQRIKTSKKLELAQNEISEKNDKINELSEQLKTALQIEDISQNQELITLKDTLSKKLKDDFNDYIQLKDREYSQDIYEAFRGSLSRIFKALKHQGIKFDESQ